MTPLSTEALTHFVCTYIHQITGVHPRDSQSCTLSEIGLDSLDLMEMVLAIEDEFATEISECLVFQEYTIAEVCLLIASGTTEVDCRSPRI